MSPLYLFVFTTLASTGGFLVVAIALFLYLHARGRIRAAFAFFVSALGLVLSTQALKETFQVARPTDALIEAVGYAFPSGHAAGSLFLALCVCYLARTLERPERYVLYAALLFIALIIGMSRIQLGVHTPFQVGIGFLLGTVWALLFSALCGRSKKK